jgi:hypothetical protein
MERVVGVVTVGLIAAVGTVGCASDSNDDGAHGSSELGGASAGTAPENRRTTPAAVAAGLQQIDTIANGIADSAGSDDATATGLDDQIEPVWQPIEGTIKSNDPNAYLTFEDNFAVLENAAKDGNAGRAKAAAAKVSAAVDAYLATYAASPA